MIRRLFLAVLAAGAGVGVSASSGPAQAAESRNFVVGWFTHATDSKDGDCPGGVNPDVTIQYLKDLALLGYSQQQIETMAQKELDGGDEIAEAMRVRGRVNGKPIEPFTYPETAIDPKLVAGIGKTGYGFDLDGKGGPKGYEDPLTHQKGVDNEMFRALGCMRTFRGSLQGRPTYWAWAWGQLLDSQPAWLVNVAGEDLSKDGEVTVTFDRALTHLRVNADGSPREDSTYRADPDPRSHNVYKGVIKDGEISIQGGGDFRMLQNPLVAPELRLAHIQMRLSLKKDGALTAFVGGYQPWRDVYLSFAAPGPAYEACVTGDIPGIYYLLKRHADADPDPKTGQNASISTTYYMEAVRAFVVPADAKPDSKTAEN
jgi:hypothetical protein